MKDLIKRRPWLSSFAVAAVFVAAGLAFFKPIDETTSASSAAVRPECRNPDVAITKYHVLRSIEAKRADPVAEVQIETPGRALVKFKQGDSLRVEYVFDCSSVEAGQPAETSSAQERRLKSLLEDPMGFRVTAVTAATK